MTGLLIADNVADQLPDLQNGGWLVAFVGLVAATLLITRRPSVVGAFCFLLASIFWLIANGAVEGPTLLAFSERRGVTLADLLPLCGVAFWGRFTRRKAG